MCTYVCIHTHTHVTVCCCVPNNHLFVQKWPVEFVLSDHRLLTAQFEVRTPQESGPSWREGGIDPLLEEPQGSSSKTCAIS